MKKILFAIFSFLLLAASCNNQPNADLIEQNKKLQQQVDELSKTVKLQQNLNNYTDNQQKLEQCLNYENDQYNKKLSSGIYTLTERQIFLQEYQSAKDDCFKLYPVK